ncbi:putative hydrolases or acyltransferase [Aaosphaeria arxii CBS 175.79]|uniref:Putative hydrolases or acyltransferase n=1 Tax=Aaosphaeria arxii CBS 175.79 TaxID=1450172 RepID=A0A6A5Y420_9PLEO|nr:putative hydrolases or acyltransferase [Aaosphaeria arxii CBS 175.79]KAF2019570.1 putative hydrolases or acyltransferase [Aaosphaeria arxii CBS 175.79]
MLELPIATADLAFNEPVQFNLRVDAELLDLTKRKLALARYPEEQDDFDEDDWSQGAKVKVVRDLANYWMNDYDWKKKEDELNSIFNHFLVKLNVPGYGPLVLHFTHAKSSKSKAIPLLFSHGWPGSFVEAMRVVGDLSDPKQPNAQAFHVVAPSIPGFGFSPAPTKSGVGPNIVARAYQILMTEVLGYRTFVTQGGDFGSFITRSVAIQFPQSVIAQHLNMFPVPHPTLWIAPLTYARWKLRGLFYSQFEKDALAVRENFETDQSGYLEQQKTRPQTLGFALGDSPVGLLAWFVEKFHDWVDCHEALSKEDTITLVMMHWIQGATPGLRFYREAFGDGKREAEKTFETYVNVPTGVSMYAKEQLHCPQDWARQVANIQYWREYHRGGHFSSLERPDAFVKDMREFFTMTVVQRAIKRGNV